MCLPGQIGEDWSGGRHQNGELNYIFISDAVKCILELSDYDICCLPWAFCGPLTRLTDEVLVFHSHIG